MRIAGTGCFLPESRYTTPEVAAMWGEGTDGSEFGIRERRWAGKLDVDAMTVDPGPLGPDPHRTMAVRAAEEALRAANVGAGEVDTILLCSCTQPIEGARFATAVTGVRTDLGLSADVHALEVTGGSASAVYAFQTVERCLRSGDRNVLLVAVNSAASHLDPVYRDRPPVFTSTIFIFGDGAGAFIFSREESRGQLNPRGACSPGHHVIAHVHEKIEARRALITNEVEADRVLYRIDLGSVARSVLGGIPAIARKLECRLEDDRGEPVDPDYYLFHQANSRLLDRLIRRMDVDPEKVLSDVGQVGNLGPAEPLVLLNRAVQEEDLEPGDEVLIATVGAGEQRSAAWVRV